MARSTEPDPPRPAPARRRPRHRPPIDDTGRRPLAAGQVIAVALLAVLIGALLNAKGLRKSAQIQDAGWQRDVALAVTEPLADVSHALYLDRPRQWLKEALGRGEDDEIDTSIDVPEPPPAVPQPKPEPRPVFSPQKPLRVWIGGDSLVIVPGQSLLDIVAHSPVMRPVGEIDGRIATGLGRPDVFDWFEHIRKQMRRLKPTAVVVSFGANDGHDYMTGVPDGVELDGLGGPRWRREYARRAGGLMDVVIRNGGYVFWIGAPLTRSPIQTRSFSIVDDVVKQEAAKRPRAWFIDTRHLFDDAGGGFTEFVPTPGGGLVRVRAEDGVHFAPAGGDRVAREVLRRFHEAFDLTSWQRRRRARPPAASTPGSAAPGSTAPGSTAPAATAPGATGPAATAPPG